MPHRKDIPGWFLDSDFKALERLAAAVPSPGCMIECGSFYGRSAWAWANTVQAGVTVFCVDLWDGIKVSESAAAMLLGELGDQQTFYITEDRFRFYTANCRNIIPIKSDSVEALKRFPDCSADLIFLDGGHTRLHVEAEMREALRVLKPGGVLCGHDFHIDSPGVFWTVIDFAMARGWDLNRELPSGSRIWSMVPVTD